MQNLSLMQTWVSFDKVLLLLLLLLLLGNVFKILIFLFTCLVGALEDGIYGFQQTPKLRFCIQTFILFNLY